MSGNPWQCDCQISFLQSVIISAVNKSDSVRLVRCWNPPNLRDVDITSLDMDCSLTQSPSIDTSLNNINNVEIIAIIGCSISIIILVIAFFIIYTRKMLVGWFKRRFFDDQSSVSSGQILQYEPYQDPVYIHHKNVTLARPSYSLNNDSQSLVRNEHYFATLAKQEQIINQGFIRQQQLQNNTMKNSPVKTCEDWIYWKDPNKDPLLNPMTEI